MIISPNSSVCVCVRVYVCVYMCAHVLFENVTHHHPQGDLCHQLEQHVLCVEMRSDAVFRREEGTGVSPHPSVLCDDNVVMLTTPH